MAFPGTYNINYYKGDTFEFNVYPKNSDGTVFNLNTDPAYTPTFTIATKRGSGSVVGSDFAATLVQSSLTVTLTSGTTDNIKAGQKIVKKSGTGVFATDVYVTAVTSSTTFTVSSGHTTAGAVVFDAAAIYKGAAEISSDKTYVKCTITSTNGLYLDPSIQYVYDVQISRSATPSSIVYTLLNGVINVTDEVTLPTGA